MSSTSTEGALRDWRQGSTYALKTASGTKLWTRLSQHKGQRSTGGGNPRGSILRRIVGAALITRDGYDLPTWGDGNPAKSDVRNVELVLECKVSGWKKFEPVWDLMIRAWQLTRVTPLLEGGLSRVTRTPEHCQ